MKIDEAARRHNMRPRMELTSRPVHWEEGRRHAKRRELRVHSRVGCGTTFTVEIPIAAGRADAAAIDG
jgi:hypothetical protein